MSHGSGIAVARQEIKESLALEAQWPHFRFVPTLSRPGAAWTGLTGYVQTHLGGVHLSTALAFLCGQKAMVEAVKKALAEKGVAPESIFLNF